jgi:glycosyltransferase involved in cell wall biosynthesis
MKHLSIPHRAAVADSGLHVAIDASRNRSGGAKAHLLGILSAGDPRQHGIAVVHVWSYDNLLRELPDVPWIIKHCPPELNQSLLKQLWWQYRKLPRELVSAGCDVLLSTDAGTVCRFTPSVVMSRDMLSFEGKEMQRYPLLSFSRLRLFLLKHMQVSSLRHAKGAIFLTQYASSVIQRFTGKLKFVQVIPHGIGERFRQKTTGGLWPDLVQSIKCVYVSNADMYKHQWHVVHAIASLRNAGHPVLLKLVGGGSGRAKVLLDEAIFQVDPEGHFVEVLDAVPHNEIPSHLAKTDIFIFASSCENMPNTLVEAMAGGLPIACSDRGPMPEIMQDAGTYFNPEEPASIAQAIEKLILEESFRKSVAEKAKVLSNQYSWERCARETWIFLAKTRENASMLEH